MPNQNQPKEAIWNSGARRSQEQFTAGVFSEPISPFFFHSPVSAPASCGNVCGESRCRRGRGPDCVGRTFLSVRRASPSRHVALPDGQECPSYKESLQPVDTSRGKCDKITEALPTRRALQ